MEIINTVVAGLFSIFGTVIGVWLSHYLQGDQNRRTTAEPPSLEQRRSPAAEPSPRERKKSYSTKSPPHQSEPSFAEQEERQIAATPQFLDRDHRFWLWLSVLMTIEIVVFSTIDADLFLLINLLFVIPIVTVVSSFLAPIRWAVAALYILVFYIATLIAGSLGGEGFGGPDDISITSGIMLANVLLCTSIVSIRSRGR